MPHAVAYAGISLNSVVEPVVVITYFIFAGVFEMLGAGICQGHFVVVVKQSPGNGQVI